MNTQKNVGGFTQKWLAGFAVLALVVGAAFVACDKDGDDDSGGDPTTPTEIRGVWQQTGDTAAIKIEEKTLKEGKISGGSFSSWLTYNYKGKTQFDEYKFFNPDSNSDYFVKPDGDNLKGGRMELNLHDNYTKVSD